MKNSILLIVGIIAIVTVVIPLNYNALTDHYTYTAPIKNSKIYPNYTHVDSPLFKGINDTFSEKLIDITLIDAQTVKINFRNDGELPPWPINDFEDFEREFGVGDSFVTRCQEDAKDSTSYLTILQFNGTRQIKEDIFADFIHADASSKALIPCNYPQIVDYSTNIFELNTIIDNEFIWKFKEG